MAIIYSYPLGTPGSADFLIGTQLASSGGITSPRTKSFTVGSIVAIAQASAASLYATKVSPILTGIATFNTTSVLLNTPVTFNNASVTGLTKTMVGLSNVDNTTDLLKPISTATQSALNLKANIASPTFTGTVSGIDKTMVGLSNVDNTSDASKPISTATQTALNLKANTLNPVFTGSVTAVSFIKTGGTNAQFLMADGSVTTTIPGSQNLQQVTTLGATTTLAISANSITTTLDSTINGLTVGKGNNIVLQNTAIGIDALSNNGTLGIHNTAIGYESLKENIGGDENTSIGSGALSSNVSGIRNTAIGRSALTTNIGGSNTAVGFEALKMNTSGVGNVALGVFALQNNTGTNNTGIGLYALNFKLSGNANISIGAEAGSYFGSGVIQDSELTTANNCIFIGKGTKPQNNNCTNEIVIGDTTLGNGSNTVTIGNASVNSVYFGGAGNAVAYCLIVSSENDSYFNSIRVGKGAGGVTSNTVVGKDAFVTNSTGTQNTAIGNLALNLNTSTNNVAVGFKSLQLNGVGNTNTAVGSESLMSNAGGDENVAIGYRTLNLATSGIKNTAVGKEAMGNTITTLGNNVAVGYRSLYVNVGEKNTGVGNLTLTANDAGTLNVAMGYEALRANIDGNRNTGIGFSALGSNTLGNQNIGIGTNAGLLTAASAANATSDFCIYIGNDTKSSLDNNNNEIVIGYNATGNGSNTVTIGASTIVKAFIRGRLNLPDLTSANYVTDVAAAAAGIAVGGLYHNAGALRIRLT